MPFKANAPIYLAGKIASMESMEFWFWMMRDDWLRMPVAAWAAMCRWRRCETRIVS